MFSPQVQGLQGSSHMSSVRASSPSYQIKMENSVQMPGYIRGAPGQMRAQGQMGQGQMSGYGSPGYTNVKPSANMQSPAYNIQPLSYNPQSPSYQTQIKR